MTIVTKVAQEMPLTISSRSRQRAIVNGYRSGLEDKLSEQISKAGLKVYYETDKIAYIVPERNSTYTPDFKINTPNGHFYVEGKGRWTVDDRHKHLLIREQHPDLDIRFVFSNANAKLYKGSPTTYAQWCEKFGFRYANKTIPTEWLEEGKQT
jgi:hypothetical protein